MIIGWKILLPLILSFIFFYIGVFLFLNISCFIQIPFITKPYISVLINSTFF
jgi:hypothetical protein